MAFKNIGMYYDCRPVKLRCVALHLLPSAVANTDECQRRHNRNRLAVTRDIWLRKYYKAVGCIGADSKRKNCVALLRTQVALAIAISRFRLHAR